MTVRSSGYCVAEDVLLCQVYMKISRDPFRSADHFWSQVQDKYNKERAEGWEERSKQSLQSRIHTIKKAVRKLNANVRQVTSMHPSGASNQDTLNQAKMLLIQDVQFKKGFKFDHVWNIAKDFETFKYSEINIRQAFCRKRSLHNVSSESDNSTQSPISVSPELPSSLNLNYFDDGGSSSGTSVGVKKANRKRKGKNNEQMLAVLNCLHEQNRLLLKLLEQMSLERQQETEFIKRKLALVERKEENRILLMNLNSISDPKIRAILQADQERIMRKRTQQ